MSWDSEDKEGYIDYSRDTYEFLIGARQWTGFNINRLNSWIRNFSGIENGEYYACKILNGLIGYSESDRAQMLLDGIERIMRKEVVFPLLGGKDFSVLPSEIDYCIQEALDKTIFSPLLVFNAPGESGDEMLRVLTKMGNSPVKHKRFVSEITEDTPCKTLVIIDDCIGSGEQFSGFWEEATIRNGKLLRDWCREKQIHPYYLCLVAFDETIRSLQEEYTDITILVIEQLSKKHGVFQMENGIWNDEQELKQVKGVLRAELEEKGIALLGYTDLDFGVIIHDSIPDWSLPIFHKEKNGWKLLVERKDSND